MKNKTLLSIGAGLLCLAVLAILLGCANFATTVFRVEQSSVNGAMTAYVGWTNYLAGNPVSTQVSNDVKQARLKFAGTVGVVDTFRVTYETNSAVKPQLQAALDSLSVQSSNLIWLIHFYQGK